MRFVLLSAVHLGMHTQWVCAVDAQPTSDSIAEFLQDADSFSFKHRERDGERLMEWEINVPQDDLPNLFADVELDPDGKGVMFINAHRGHVTGDGIAYKISFGPAKRADERIKLLVLGPGGPFRLRINGDARQTFNESIRDLIAVAQSTTKGKEIDSP